jgi:hypothetical protein
MHPIIYEVFDFSTGLFDAARSRAGRRLSIFLGTRLGGRESDHKIRLGGLDAR